MIGLKTDICRQTLETIQTDKRGGAQRHSMIHVWLRQARSHNNIMLKGKTTDLDRNTQGNKRYHKNRGIQNDALSRDKRSNECSASTQENFWPVTQAEGIQLPGSYLLLLSTNGSISPDPPFPPPFPPLSLTARTSSHLGIRDKLRWRPPVVVLTFVSGENKHRSIAGGGFISPATRVV